MSDAASYLRTASEYRDRFGPEPDTHRVIGWSMDRMERAMRTALAKGRPVQAEDFPAPAKLEDEPEDYITI